MSDDFDSPNAKYFKDIYKDKLEKSMVEMDLFNLKCEVEEWLDGTEKVDPDICRYMGMALLSLANRLEPDS